MPIYEISEALRAYLRARLNEDVVDKNTFNTSLLKILTEVKKYVAIHTIIGIHLIRTVTPHLHLSTVPTAAPPSIPSH